jgi:hypothetical protein
MIHSSICCAGNRNAKSVSAKDGSAEILRSARLPGLTILKPVLKVSCNLSFYARDQPLCIVLSFMCSLILNKISAPYYLTRQLLFSLASSLETTT